MTTEEHPPPIEDTAPAPPAPPTARRTRRRRRPSGAPPPLPRHIGTTGKTWLVLLVGQLAWVLVALVSPDMRRLTDQVDHAVLRTLSGMRVDWLNSVMRAVNRVGSGWAVSIAAGILIVLMIVFRRWRHLFTFLAAVLVVELLAMFLYTQFTRPRPYDVTTIGSWTGFSAPSTPVCVVSFVLVGVTYSMFVAGRSRTIAKIVSVAIASLFVVARLYLAVDHPFDAFVGVALGVAIPLNAFRFFTPNETFPVTYRRGKTAHLDVGGRRGEAIRRAIQDQLGMTVLDIRPVGLAGSGGSTPLKLRVAGDPDIQVFGKLYAMNHVRADRWYKLGRTILYGRLEDERPYQTVRRLVQHEDYALRLLRDVGLPTAAPFGIVELTPEREYMLVTEFFDGAREIGDADIDDAIIDDGLAIVRRLWDAGLAHRDIKPANLLVKDGRMLVIDVAFAQVRPSPWRQAVDLANMMLVLAVRTDAERVYQRALNYFTPDEIAEAFAATRGIASPTQLRAMMKRDGRDLVSQFRALAPERRPISLQRWSVRRVLMAFGLLVAAFVAVLATAGMFTPAELDISAAPNCGTGDVVVLMAQAVPTATQVPCIDNVPAGWDPSGADVRRGRATFWLDSDQAGHHAVRVSLLPPSECSTADASEQASDEIGIRRFERIERLAPGLRATRFYLFDGGCVTYRFAFTGDAPADLMFVMDGALSFQPRTTLIERVRDRSGLRLCGAGVPLCEGGS